MNFIVPNLRRLHPRRRIAGGAHRVTDPYGRAEAPYKGAESENWNNKKFIYKFYLLNLFFLSP